MLLDPIKPAYDQINITASAFKWLWISMPVVLVTVPTVTQNSLYLPQRWLKPSQTERQTTKDHNACGGVAPPIGRVEADNNWLINQLRTTDRRWQCWLLFQRYPASMGHAGTPCPGEGSRTSWHVGHYRPVINHRQKLTPVLTPFYM